MQEQNLSRVAKRKGKYRSIDNRRLYCYKAVGIQTVPVVITDESSHWRFKNRPKNDGTDIQIIDVAHNPKHLDLKVVAYDPSEERPSRCYIVGDVIAIEEAAKAKTRKPTIHDASRTSEGSCGPQGITKQSRSNAETLVGRTLLASFKISFGVVSWTYALAAIWELYDSTSAFRGSRFYSGLIGLDNLVI